MKTKEKIGRYMKAAAKAWGGATLNVKAFADAYVAALAADEQAARDAFSSAYPLFGPREWRKLELVGRGTLLPQLFFKSDCFVGKILARKDSKDAQSRLAEAAENEEDSPEERVAKCRSLVSEVNRSRSGIRPRRASEILDELVDAIIVLEALRDEEWSFEEEHGGRESWDGGTCVDHDELLGRIQQARMAVRDLAREAKGDPLLEV